MAEPSKESKPVSPPLRVDSTLHLAWGLTLFLSSDEKQKDFAGKFVDLPILKSSGAEYREYIDNLIAVILAYLRRMGFEKEEYDSFLNAQRESLKTVNTYWTDLGTMTSFSTESTIMKVTSFLGFGASGEYMVNWLQSFAKSGVVEVSKKATESGTTEGVADMAKKVTESEVAEATKTIAEPLFSQQDIGFILIFGAIGLTATIAFLKGFGNYRINRKRESIKKVQQKYWTEVMRPRYKEALVHLYGDLEILVKKFYPEYKEEPLLDNKIGDNSKNIELTKIIDEILPYELIYYPYIPEKKDE